MFLSFRGIDTRYGFTGNLCRALRDKGIHTFFDDDELQRGEEITPALLKAIEGSRIAIPIFSINYASSSFTLDELLHIVECVKANGRLVLPIFYDVDPSHVRHQQGNYKEAMSKHEARFSNDDVKLQRIQKWKMALNQVANLSGYHFKQGSDFLIKLLVSFFFI